MQIIQLTSEPQGAWWSFGNQGMPLFTTAAWLAERERERERKRDRTYEERCSSKLWLDSVDTLIGSAEYVSRVVHRTKK